MIPWLALFELTAACYRVEGDQIEARHLLWAAPGLAALAPGAVFGYTPRFGVRRTVPGFEIEAFARRHGLTVTVKRAVCIERPATRLEAADLGEALREAAQALCHCTVRVTLGAFARYPVPPGRLVFPAGGAGYPGPDGELHWRGYVEAGNRVPIWAKARVEAEREVVVAADALAAGTVLTAADIRRESRVFGVRETPAAFREEEAVGMMALRRVEAGAVLTRAMLTRPPEIRAGEMISVESASGAVRLSLDARAESPGRRGDRIVARNLANGVRFQAVVAGPGRAIAAGAVAGSASARPGPPPAVFSPALAVRAPASPAQRVQPGKDENSAIRRPASGADPTNTPAGSARR